MLRLLTPLTLPGSKNIGNFEHTPTSTALPNVRVKFPHLRIGNYLGDSFNTQYYMVKEPTPGTLQWYFTILATKR